MGLALHMEVQSFPENTTNNLVLLHLRGIAEDCVRWLGSTEARWQTVAVSN